MSSRAAAGIQPTIESGTQRLDDTLAELSAGRPVWTALYAAHDSSNPPTWPCARTDRPPGSAHSYEPAQPAEESNLIS